MALTCSFSNVFAAKPVPPPVVSIQVVTPSSGDTAGGVAITITGSGFQAGASVYIGNITASSVTVLDSGTISATTPPHSSGLVDVAVSNPDGSKATLADGFLYVIPIVCDPNAPGDPDPSIVIESPATLTEIAGDTVLVTGTFSGPINSGVSVNGVTAITDSGRFYANNVPLVPGSNMLIATVVTPLGKTASAQIDVTSNGSDMLKLHVKPMDAVVGEFVSFSHEYKGTAPIQSVTVDSGKGSVYTYTPIQSILEVYQFSGVYIVTLSTRDSQGVVLSTQYALQITNTGSLSTTHLSTFSKLRNALVCGQDNIALSYFSSYARVRFQPILGALKPVLPHIVNTWSDLQEVSVTSRYAEYAINQVIDGVNRLFFVYFVRDDDGVWRIEAM
jgi:hypothetical protein